MQSKLKKKILITILITIGIIVLVFSFFIIKNDTGNVKSAAIAIPTQVPVPQKVSDLIKTVNQQTKLPQGEIPTVATVSDVSKLPNTPFFTNAQNGDKVLIYGGSGKAYLYRPSTKEIIQESSVEIMTNTMADASPSADIATPSGIVTPILKIHY